jgi:hypothetical protein
VAAFSFFKQIPEETKTIYILSNNYVVPPNELDPCGMKRKALLKWLAKTFPGKKVVETSGTIFEDYWKLVHTPHLFMDFSSFAMYAALANNGQIYSRPIYNQKYPLSNWHFWDGPTLLGRRPQQLRSIWEKEYPQKQKTIDDKFYLRLEQDYDFSKKYFEAAVEYLSTH